MSAYLRRGTHPDTAAWLRRLIAPLAVVACSVLGWAGIVPAASAAIIPVPGDGPYGPASAPAVRVIAAGGMPGWQITLIAVAAALAAATAAVYLDRARARRTASTHRMMSPARAGHPPGPDQWSLAGPGRARPAGAQRALSACWPWRQNNPCAPPPGDAPKERQAAQICGWASGYQRLPYRLPHSSTSHGQQARPHIYATPLRAENVASAADRVDGSVTPGAEP